VYMRHISFSSFLDKIAVRVLTVDLSDFFAVVGLGKERKRTGNRLSVVTRSCVRDVLLVLVCRWYGTGGKIIGINQ
jgi:hypothetical protein